MRGGTNHGKRRAGFANGGVPTLLSSRPHRLAFNHPAHSTGARRYTNSAFGFKGYRLGEGGGHSNFTYYESLDLQADVSVDVLGGFVGVAYRSGFFSLARLMDYASYPAGAFFVDDDWIGSVLADAGVERVVLSAENGGEVSRYLFEEEVITPVAHIRSLNGKHGFRCVFYLGRGWGGGGTRATEQ